MNDTTRLEPLPATRARQLLELLQQTSHIDGSALALDETGHVTGIVAADDEREEHLLGDLDVHA